jgi:hypothetical protein
MDDIRVCKGMSVLAVSKFAHVSTFAEVRGFCIHLDQRARRPGVFRVGLEIGIEPWRPYAKLSECGTTPKGDHYPRRLLVR